MLRLPAPRRLLLDALEDVERLVLLGDVAELVTRNPRRSLAAAEPALREIGQRLGAGREVIVVPGNHDAPLVREWVRAQGRGLAVDGSVPLDCSRALARLSGWLAPATVRAHYPGVWLDERTYATHGHYMEHYLIPASPIGLPRGPLGRSRERPSRPADYERARSTRGRRRQDRRDGVTRRPLAALAELGRVRLLPQLPRLLLRARMSPVTAAAVDLQMRRAALPAMARVLDELAVGAEHVIFGHVHRRAPLKDERWKEPRLINTGSWLYEPLLIDRARPPHPYWPGGAVVLEPGRPPHTVGLLDSLDHEQLRPISGIRSG